MVPRFAYKTRSRTWDKTRTARARTTVRALVANKSALEAPAGLFVSTSEDGGRQLRLLLSQPAAGKILPLGATVRHDISSTKVRNLGAFGGPAELESVSAGPVTGAYLASVVAQQLIQFHDHRWAAPQRIKHSASSARSPSLCCASSRADPRGLEIGLSRPELNDGRMLRLARCKDYFLTVSFSSFSSSRASCSA